MKNRPARDSRRRPALYERSYVVSSDGNVSVRLDDGRIVATPTMTCKGRMTEESLAVTDIEGKPLSDRRASSELADAPVDLSRASGCESRLSRASTAWNRLCALPGWPSINRFSAK